MLWCFVPINIIQEKMDIKFKTRVNGLLIGLFFLNVLFVYCTYSRLVEGPFIFGDETEYFKLAKEIARQGKLMSISQYNPLYPILISFFVNKNISLTLSYELIKLFNIVAFSTMLFPIFYISLSLLKNKWMAYGLALFAVNMPFKALSVLVWAEPLYYSLFAWCMWGYLSFTDTPNMKRALRLGILLCLLLYTKQSGLILIISVALGLLYEVFYLKRINWKTAFFLGGFLFLGYMPWIVRNITMEQSSALGYVETASYLESLINVGVFTRAFMYQLSYVICSLFMIFFVLFIYDAVNIKRKSLHCQSFTLVVVFFVLGITMLSALHRMSGSTDEEAIKMTFGRYLDSIFPFIIIMVISSLRKKTSIKGSLNRYALGGIIILTGLVFLTSPIRAAIYSYGYLNNVDLVYLNDIINGYGKIVWTPNQYVGAQIPLIYSIVLFSLTMIYCVLKESHKKIYLCLLMAFILFVGFRGETYIYKLSNARASENEVAKFLINNNIERELIRVNSNSSYGKTISEFWFDEDFDKMDISPITDPDTERIIGVSFETVAMEQLAGKLCYIITEEELPCNLVFKNSKYKIYQISSR